MKEAKYAHAVVEWIEMQILNLDISVFFTVAGNFI